MGFDSPLHYKKKNTIICAHGAGPRRKTRIKSKIKKIMKKILTSAIAILAMVGCTSEDFVGDKELQRQNEEGAPISFNLVSAPPTRAVERGGTAAESLNKNFVVYGWKTVTTGGSSTPQVVFNNYQANYIENSAATTTSNSAGWEYVGYKNVPEGVTTNVGVTDFATSTTDNASGVDQSIKYWDYSASAYNFYGYSLGKGVTSTGGASTTTTYATASKLSHMTPISSISYTLTGSQAQLLACYISDLLTKTDMSATNTQVELQFRKMESKIKIAFYENIPGYSVKDIKFYKSASVSSGASEGYGNEAFLYTIGTGSIPVSGKYTIKFDESSGKPQLAFDGTGTGGSSITELSFGNAVPTTGTVWTDWEAAEYKEKVGGTDLGSVYIGRSSSLSTKSPSVSVLPNPNGTELGLKIDYTLVALDGYGETIEVKGATATVPAAYAQWQPNCSYTYVFKISDNTNGSTGKDIIGLSPITLDAVVNTNADGKQETITTVSTPSITTYQKGSNVTGMDEYYAGNIYVVVGDGGSGYELTPGTNAKLYTATIDDGAIQGITESTVANAIKNGTHSGDTWTVTDADGKNLTVTAASGLTGITSIPAADTPNGKAITIYGASFAATAGTSTKYYIFEYIYEDTTDPSNPVEKKLYKVIKVGPITTYQKDVTSTEEYQAGNVYFWVGDGTTALTVDTDAKLYTVTNVAESGAAENPVSEINEVSVANVLANGTETSGSWSLTDANNWTMTVASKTGLTAFTTIPADDSSSGSADTSKKGVTFAAVAGTTYVLEYINNSKKYYKVINVAAGS